MNTHRGRVPRSLAVLALAVCLGHGPATRAADIVVNSVSSAVNGSDGLCTLTEALVAAGIDLGSGGAAGECAAGNGADVILLQAASQLYTVSTVNNNVVNGPTGLPVVFTDITIQGGPSTIQRSTAAGTPDFRLLQVNLGGNLRLVDLTIRNGRADLYGGGVLAAVGNLELTRTEIAANVAGCDGGGIASFGGNLQVSDSTLHDNIAGCSGGGAYVGNGPSTFTDTQLLDNASQTGGGGALMVSGSGSAQITRVTMDGNSAVLDGGALLAHGGATVTTIVDSIITNNRCEPLPAGLMGGNGGGIANGRVDNDGAVEGLVEGGTMTITRSTVSNNVAARSAGFLNRPFGGGIANVGDLTVEDSTIAENQAIEGRGGGIFTIDATLGAPGLLLRGSVVRGNSVTLDGHGGGLALLGAANVTRTQITGNRALQGGGAVVRANSGAAGGGATRISDSSFVDNRAAQGSALAVFGGVVSETLLHNTTVSGNRIDPPALDIDRGALDASSALRLNGVTVTGNSGGSGGLFALAPIAFHNSIVAGNIGFDGAYRDCHQTGAGSWQPSYSVIGEATGCPGNGLADMRSIDPARVADELLWPLNDNGAAAPSHGLRPASLAMEGGDPDSWSVAYPSGCLATDQRGTARPQDDDGDGGARCDIGAVEGNTDPLFSDGFE